MPTSTSNHYDAIERVIFETGVRISAVDFHPEMDIMMVLLNSKKVLQFPLSRFERLRPAGIEQLKGYELIAEGVGIHWPELDEDISLKGLLEFQLVSIIGGDMRYAMAA